MRYDQAGNYSCDHDFDESPDRRVFSHRDASKDSHWSGPKKAGSDINGVERTIVVVLGCIDQNDDFIYTLSKVNSRPDYHLWLSRLDVSSM